MNATAAAEAETQFRTGMDLLATPSPDWDRAMGLIDSAAAAGHADALERRALLECMGVGRASSWDQALDSLTAAAESGSQFAARQLILLGYDRFVPASAKPPREDWAGLRSRIAIARRLSPPATPGRFLSASPIVHAIPGFASAAECQWLVASAEPRLKRAGVYNNPTGVDPGRTNEFAAFNFANSDIVVELIRNRIAGQIRAPLACLEMAQVLHYDVGQEFVLHCDFLDPRTERAVLARGSEPRPGRRTTFPSD